MADDFSTFREALTSPADNFLPITPSDAVPVDPTPRAIFAGGGGTLVVTGTDGVEATFTVVSGQLLPIRPVLVKTASTATGIVGVS